MGDGAGRRMLAASLALAASLGALLILTPSALAAESIRSLDVEAVIDPSGRMTVTETIEYDFDGEFRRGIFRLIPVYDDLPDGSRWIHPVTVTDVTVDGGATPYAVTQQGPLLEVKIGDPDVTITGVHEYAITYTVDGVMRSLTAEDLAEANPYGFAVGDAELYWDFTGNSWQVPIVSTQVRVTGPGTVLAAQCYRGYYGSSDPCQDRIQGDTAQFATALLHLGFLKIGCID